MAANRRDPLPWPTVANRLRVELIATCDALDTRLGDAERAADRLQPDLAIAHIRYVRRELVSMARKLERARDGQPDALAQALELLADALTERLCVDDVRQFLARYQEAE